MDHIKYTLKPISESEIAQKTAHLVFEDLLTEETKLEHLTNEIIYLISKLVEERKYRIIILSCYIHLNKIIESLEILKFKEIFFLDSWPVGNNRTGVKKFYHIDLEGYKINV